MLTLTGAFSSVEEIPENLVHDHEKNGLPRLSSLPPREITHRLVNRWACRIVAVCPIRETFHLFIFVSTD